MDRTALIATLVAVDAEHGCYLDGDTEGRYFDWGSGTDDTFRFEVSDGEAQAIIVEMSRDELRRLHTQLTLTLLAGEA